MIIAFLLVCTKGAIFITFLNGIYHGYTTSGRPVCVLAFCCAGLFLYQKDFVKSLKVFGKDTRAVFGCGSQLQDFMKKISAQINDRAEE